MLDFRPKGRRASHSPIRSDQWRLMLLIGTMAAVMLMMAEARNPQIWRMLGFRGPAAGGFNGPAAGNAAGGPQAAPGAAAPEIDTRLKPKDKPPLKAGEFIAEPRGKRAPPEGKKFFPGVDAELLAEVRDDTVFRSGEADAFYHLLGILAKTDEKSLEQASRGPVTFTQLFTQPKEYRGELVTVEGTLRRNESLRAVKNKYGIERYAKLVIQPKDRAEPLLVYCLEPPAKLPFGDDLNEPIKATGFFYKRQAGMAGDGIRTWPLVLAKTVQSTPPAPAAAPAQRDAVSPTLAVVVSIGFALAVVWFVLGRTGRGAKFRIPAAGDPEARRVLARHGLSALKNEPLEPDERERFVRMAQQAEAGSGGAESSE
ncbi:MAG TPA: hypothetical protein VMV10_24840 [Pirellulales bacterium]|nr:hypothetical protein [Pirellulales bacterium]